MASDAQHNIFHILIVSIGLLLTGCMGADTRGSEAPDHIVISGTPTWTNGIGELVNKKCAVCHQVPRLPSSPTNVPADLDLRYETTAGSLRAAADIAAPISLGILHHSLNFGLNTPVNIQTMPLAYSTPLYADETIALETWAANILAQGSTSPAPTDGPLLYKRHCQGCHGMYGAGGVVNRTLRGYTGTGLTIATYILTSSATHPMHNWPLLMQFATACNTNCSSNQLASIAAYLATQ